MPEGSTRTRGIEAHKHNILAGKALAETVRTTLGPKGMDKMVVSSDGEVTITNDGVTILEAMEVQHPTAKMIVEAAKTQEDEIGDGTTTVVVIAGELLKSAEGLLEQGIHPTIIIRGYKMALNKAMSVLKELAKEVSPKNPKLLRDIAVTAMTGKGVEESKEKLAELVVKGVLKVVSEEGLRNENIKLLTKPGGSVEDSKLVEGIVLEKERLKEGMPTRVENARIALIDAPIEVKETEIDSKITISSPEQMEQFIEMEEGMIKAMVQKIVDAGANVVFCQRGIDELAQHYLEEAGVYALRRVKLSDMKLLARATGARIVSEPNQITAKDLGKAGVVYEEKIGDEYMTFVSGCENTRAVTILLRGGSEHVLDEVKRALMDAIGDIGVVIATKEIVGGAGSAEIEISRELTRFADKLSGREQLAVQGFAKAMEIIPVTLAENSGLDPISVITKLKAEHDKGKRYAGIDVLNGRVVDTLPSGIVEPLRVKTQALSSAVEVVTMILRIDDIIVNEPPKSDQQEMPKLE
ncbi:thermosome subunit [Candidatus Woesearchaeota archaeon]|nr:MAG: thermosome subunit [Candidatus Woesearchaeota archaeon]